MLLAAHVVGVPAVPLKVTVLVPLVAPKLVPLIVTAVATGPLDGERLVSVGVGETVNGSVLLARPPTVTTTLPVAAPAGTGTTMLLADQIVGVAAVPLKVTVLVPFVAPKLLPLMVMAGAAAPLDGDRLVTRRPWHRVGQRVARHATDGDQDVAGRGAGRGRGSHDARRRTTWSGDAVMPPNVTLLCLGSIRNCHR